MQLLELLYQKEFKNIPFISRKLSIAEDSKVILCGTSGSGKTFLVYDYLQFESYGSYLYIDFDDFRVSGITKDKLEKFCDEKKITTLVLENFDFAFEPPDVLKLIITSKKKLYHDGYVTKILYPLDFEEFTSFEKKFISEQVSFNNFSRKGTYPHIALSSEESFEKNFNLMLKATFRDELEFFIVRYLSKKQGSIVTLLGLFKELKEQVKISKDKFYAVMKNLENQLFIFFVPKYGVSSYSKKLYLVDFAIRGIVSYEKDFLKRFENIVFLELLKRDEKIFYHDRIDFVLPEKSTAITTILFLPKQMIEQKINLLLPIIKSLGLIKLKVITLESEFEFERDGITCEVLTFWSFVFGL